MKFDHALSLLYIFLAIYAAGMMTTLQLQHFALYPRVGREAFGNYIAANNKAAIIPSIVPAVLLLIITAVLSFVSHPMIPRFLVGASLACNCINLVSTGVWQARLHGELARCGYQELLVRKLIKTNWIRTLALLVQAALATGAVAQLCNVS